MSLPDRRTSAQWETWSEERTDTVVAALGRAVDAHPEHLFLDFGDERLTFGDTWRETLRLARGLHELDVRPGDTVISMLDNVPDAVLLWFANNLLGAIHVPVNTAYKGEFLRHQIDDTGARLIVAEAEYADRILAIADGLPQARNLLRRGHGSMPSSSRILVSSLDAHRRDKGKLPEVVVHPHDLTMLIYTAGTTGPSKGCMISHNYACNLARQGIESSGRRPEELNWTALPLFHLNATATSVLGSLLLGGACAIATRFSLSSFWPEIERTGARTANLLGAMIPLIAAMEDTPEMRRCKGQLRIARGAPFPADLEEVWRERFGVEVTGTPGFGLTEAALITSLPPGVRGRPDTSGLRNADFDVRIFDDDDHEVPDGNVGEIVCRPRRPHVMFDGYWRRPEATVAVLRNMWFHTGDLGRFDDDGFLHFVDRKKDYLRRRGENISSFEMENTYRAHPAIDEVAVHAVASEFTEDDVKVTAVLAEGASLREEELFEWSIDHVPYFALPRYIEFRSSLPKSPVGRVFKYQLRDEGCTPETWDREKAGVVFEKR
jgi:carnitine-CoA ligase